MMLPDDSNYREAFAAREPEVLELLRKKSPVRVVSELQRQGWPRVWACELVGKLEREHNPAGLKLGADVSQRLRAQHLRMVILGGVAFVIGWAVVILSAIPEFVGRGFIILAYGAIICGAICLWRGFTILRACPDRRIPGCGGPDGADRSHRPGTY